MRFSELLLRLEALLDWPLVRRSPSETLEAIRRGAQGESVYGQCLQLIVQWCLVKTADAALTRGSVIEALGPLRRRYMAADAPSEDLRRLQQVIEAIDAAYDAAALEQRSPPQH